MTYAMKSVDLDGIELAAELNDLIEALAENIHDQWARGRIREGWRYGAERNDQEKLHPCLVPYNELPESEKEYDRVTAVTTLKFILKAGFEISPKQGEKL